MLAASPIGELPSRTRYAQRSGLHIAYRVIGEGPLDIALMSGFPVDGPHLLRGLEFSFPALSSRSHTNPWG